MPVATALTLTAPSPSSGLKSVASANFTVGYNGTIAAGDTVSFSDGALGGTFTPSTLVFTSGPTPSTQTVTYTPATVGTAITITASDTLALTSATANYVSYTAAADTFIDTGGTVLSSHTPTGTGAAGSWVQHTSYTGGTTTVGANNGIYGTTTGKYSVYYNNITHGSADYDVTVSFQLGGNGGQGVTEYICAAGRINTSDGTCYIAMYNNGVSVTPIKLFRVSGVTAGVPTLVNIGGGGGSTVFNTNYQTTHSLMLRMRTNQISVWFDGAQVGSTATDGNITAAGQPGTFIYNSFSQNTNKEMSWYTSTAQLSPVANDPIVSTAVTTNASANATGVAVVAGAAPICYTGTQSVQWQRAPDSSGSPGTYANIGTANILPSYTDITGTAGTKYWLRYVVSDGTNTATSTGVTYTAATYPSVIISGSNANWVLDPYNPFIEATTNAIVFPGCGNEGRIFYQGSANVTVYARIADALENQEPVIACLVDGVLIDRWAMNSGAHAVASTYNTLPGNDGKIHQLELINDAVANITTGYVPTGGGATGRTVVVTKVGFDSGTVFTTPAKFSNTVVFLTDSIGQGTSSLGAHSDTNLIGTDSNIRSYPYILRRMLQAEVCQVSYSGMGLQVNRVGNGIPPIWNSGVVASPVVVTVVGSGYTSTPTVTFSAPIGAGTTATGTAVLTSQTLTSITLVNAGVGYSSPPTITISGGGGSGATASCSLVTTSQSGSWNKVWSGVNRVLGTTAATAPTLIIIEYQNDYTFNAVYTALTQMVPVLKASLPGGNTTKIMICGDFAGAWTASEFGAVEALGVGYVNMHTGTWTANMSYDGLHPSAFYDIAYLAPTVAGGATPIINSNNTGRLT